MKKLFLLFLIMAFPAMMGAQTRNVKLTIEVASVQGDDMANQLVTLMQTDYQVSYGSLKLNADGQCTVKVYPGNHSLTIERDGFETVSQDFLVPNDVTEFTVSVTLQEKTRMPFALQAAVVHDVFTGKDDIAMTWNTESPAFFDDFESYEPFAVNFGEWTGIDADNEMAAPLIGNYPNRGVMQYAQIINPLTVEPTWWYDYPILRPYAGQQYVGFTRTSSGNANDDWLISPVITVGTDNILSFMGKAADRYPERFMVFVTTVLDNPVQSDFVRLDQGNYETADYKGWKAYTYDLSVYAGQQVKFAIRYISHYNYYGSFMLMVDDVYVGQPSAQPSAASKARKVTDQLSMVNSRKSPANPNEHFVIFLDGEQVATTEGYSYTLEDVGSGEHTIGVQAVYIQGQSEVATATVTVPESGYSHVVFNVSANSKLSADGQQLSLLSKETAESYMLTVADGKAEVLSLPNGQYVVNVAEGAFSEYQQTITVGGDTTYDILLEDHILDPYNITANLDIDGNLTVRWNQELIYTESFEDYDDFATGQFGEWKTIDLDQQPVYPIALGSQTNIVSFPGSGTASNPTAIPPMVFNPWATTPAMLPTDQAIAAPTGDKTVIFFSPQRAKADKWLISPLFDIHDNYVLNVTAKGYSAMYPESMEFCISTGSDNTADFTAISRVEPMGSEEWTIYQTDLSNYAGQTVRLAVHYTSYDAFLAQIDDFTVGPEDGQGEVVDYGNVVRFDIFFDGKKVAETTVPTFIMEDVAPGHHVIGIQAIYQNGQSALVEYVLEDVAGIKNTPLSTIDSQQSTLFDLLGRPVQHSVLKKGVYICDGKKIVIQ